ncbi:MAG: FliH/SctL family protein [Bacteriovoracia bacterium]
MVKQREDKIQVEEYSFADFQPTGSEICDFEMHDFDTDEMIQKRVDPVIIRQERQAEEKSAFVISPVVKKYRGLIKQEQQDYQKQIDEAIEEKLATVREEAYQQGYDAGAAKGYEDAKVEADQQFIGQVQQLAELVEQVQSFKDEFLEEKRQEIFKMIKAISKWVVLKEIRNDSYISDLLEKMILELQTKSGLLIKVNPDNFDNMPKVLEIVQKRLGELTNVRVELAHDQTHPGIILESQNGIIDGTLDAQMTSIDEIFETLGIDSDS